MGPNEVEDPGDPGRDVSQLAGSGGLKGPPEAALVAPAPPPPTTIYSTVSGSVGSVERAVTSNSPVEVKMCAL